MSDFLSHLVARSLGVTHSAGQAETVQPRPISRFDPAAQGLTVPEPLEDQAAELPAVSQSPRNEPPRAPLRYFDDRPATMTALAPPSPIAPLPPREPMTVRAIEPPRDERVIVPPAPPTPALLKESTAPADGSAPHTMTSSHIVERLMREPVVERDTVAARETVIERTIERELATPHEPLPRPAPGALHAQTPQPAAPQRADERFDPVVQPRVTVAPSVAVVQPRVSVAPPASSRIAASQPEAAHHEATPTIHVTIGRIEVRAAPPAASVKRSRPASAGMSLEEYLRSRDGGRR